jgi:hypothetical protein
MCTLASKCSSLQTLGAVDLNERPEILQLLIFFSVLLSDEVDCRFPEDLFPNFGMPITPDSLQCDLRSNRAQ